MKQMTCSWQVVIFNRKFPRTVGRYSVRTSNGIPVTLTETLGPHSSDYDEYSLLNTLKNTQA
jgi:hypothetical protein